MKPEDQLRSRHIELPPPPRPVANYVTSVRVGNLLYVSGHGPAAAPGVRTTGKVGQDLTVDEGARAARQTGLNLLSTIRAAVGSLDEVERVVKVLGMVNCGPDFQDHPKVINGCSDLFVEVFGENGRGARSAVGMSSLPGGIATEVEAIVLLKEK